MTIAAGDFIAGMAKGLAVLESFDTQRQRLNATLAAQRAGITRAAARRHLLTLAHLGYLHTDGSYFWLSPKVLRFSGSFLASSHLPRVLQPALNRLAAQTAANASAVVRDGSEVVIIARAGNPVQSVSGSGLLAYGLHLGARLPAHATSTGQVLLAAMPKLQFNNWLKTQAPSRTLPRLTPHTVTDVQAFRALIDQVRAADHALSVQAHELGVQALAVPVRNTQGQVVAAINLVCAPQSQDPASLRRDWLPLLADAAQTLRSLV
jgi:IclR family transcriptional regulator, pca regulon regulatory protein